MNKRQIKKQFKKWLEKNVEAVYLTETKDGETAVIAKLTKPALDVLKEQEHDITTENKRF